MPTGTCVPVTFHVYREGQLIRTDTVTREVIELGRMVSAHVQLDDQSVALSHAVIEVSASEVRLLDRGSPGGTRVNGRAVGRARLRSGDEITIGRCTVVVVVGVAAAMPVPPPLPAARTAAPAPPPAPDRAIGERLAEAAAPTERSDGSRSIEVVALFEDAIVATHHLTDPSAGGVTGATRGLLWGGAGAIATALALVVLSFLRVGGLNGRAGDALFLLCGASGLAALVWGLLRRFEERQPRDFTVGPGRAAMVSLPGGDLPVDRFPLVRAAGDHFELTFTPSMRGEVTAWGRSEVLADLVDGRAHPVDHLAGAWGWPIPDGAQARVELGAATILVRSVPAPRRYPVPLRLDTRALSCIGATTAAWLVFLGLVFTLPPDAHSLSLEHRGDQQRLARYTFSPAEHENEKIPTYLQKGGETGGAPGKRAAGPEGQIGNPNTPRSSGHKTLSIKGPPHNADPHLAKQQAQAEAAKAGVLGILRANQGSVFASVFGRESALGSDAEDHLGNLIGVETGDAWGCAGCSGTVGSGRGGGGTGLGTIGIGPLARIAPGGGGIGKRGWGPGGPGLGTHTVRAIDGLPPPLVKVNGAGIDKELIRRVVRQHHNEVKFCYEKELSRHPDLYGRVVVAFTIAGAGKVLGSSVAQSSMKSPEVEQCIAGAVRRWDFPKSPQSGIVQVSYPFVLHAAENE